MRIRRRKGFPLVGLWGPQPGNAHAAAECTERDVPGTLACLEEFLAAQQPWQANATPLYRHVPAKMQILGPNFAARLHARCAQTKILPFCTGEPGFEAILQQFEQAAACGQRAAEPVEM